MAKVGSTEATIRDIKRKTRCKYSAENRVSQGVPVRAI